MPEVHTCLCCRLGDLKDLVCQLCGAIFCEDCRLLFTPSSNLPEQNCRCRPLDWHTPGVKKARKLEG